ncbi:MAG TPA: hypothetical protein VGE27_06655 [Gemmatimonas sp.]
MLSATACTYDTPLEPPAEDTPSYDLLFESTQPGAEGIPSLRLMVYRTDNGTISPLFGQEIHGSSPSVSADGQRVVFVGESVGDVDYDYQDLWVVTRGSAPRRLALPSGTEHAPSMAPNGGHIAYALAGESLFSHIHLTDIDGRMTAPLALAMAPGLEYTYTSPSWSPDGSRLIFSAGVPGTLHLYTMRANGTLLQQVTNAASSDIDGAWSPDGRTIAFIRTLSSSRQILMTRDLNTGAERSFEYANRSRHPAWSPDGSRIAFVSNMSDNGDLELYTVNPDGSALTRLTNDNVRQQYPRWIKR